MIPIHYSRLSTNDPYDSETGRQKLDQGPMDLVNSLTGGISYSDDSRSLTRNSIRRGDGVRGWGCPSNHSDSSLLEVAG